MYRKKQHVGASYRAWTQDVEQPRYTDEAIAKVFLTGSSARSRSRRWPSWGGSEGSECGGWPFAHCLVGHWAETSREKTDNSSGWGDRRSMVPST